MVPDKVEKLCLRAQQAIAARDWEKAKQVYLMALGSRRPAGRSLRPGDGVLPVRAS